MPPCAVRCSRNRRILDRLLIERMAGNYALRCSAPEILFRTLELAVQSDVALPRVLKPQFHSLGGRFPPQAAVGGSREPCRVRPRILSRYGRIQLRNQALEIDLPSRLWLTGARPQALV